MTISASLVSEIDSETETAVLPDNTWMSFDSSLPSSSRACENVQSTHSISCVLDLVSEGDASMLQEILR